MMHPRQPPEYHERQVGTEVEWTRTSRTGRTTKGRGKIVGFRLVEGRIVNVKTGDAWRVVEVVIRTQHRKILRMRFADRAETPAVKRAVRA